MLSPHSTLAIARKGFKCYEESDDDKRPLGIAKFAANKAYYDDTKVMEERSKIEFDFVAKVGRKKDALGELHEKIRQLGLSFAAWLK